MSQTPPIRVFVYNEYLPTLSKSAQFMLTQPVEIGMGRVHGYGLYALFNTKPLAHQNQDKILYGVLFACGPQTLSFMDHDMGIGVSRTNVKVDMDDKSVVVAWLHFNKMKVNERDHCYADVFAWNHSKRSLWGD